MFVLNFKKILIILSINHRTSNNYKAICYYEEKTWIKEKKYFLKKYFNILAKPLMCCIFAPLKTSKTAWFFYLADVSNGYGLVAQLDRAPPF